MNASRDNWRRLLASLTGIMIGDAPASAQQQKPNILVIMGDDIGYWNISAYNRGMMGYRTPNIERAQHEAGDYVRWFVEHAFVHVPAQVVVGSIS